MMPKIQREIKLKEAIDSGKYLESSKETSTSLAVKFLCNIFKSDSLVASSAIESMNDRGQSSISESEKNLYAKESFYRASAQMMPLHFCNLPLSTKCDLQKKAISAASSIRLTLEIQH